MAKMRYISTRGQAAPLGFSEAATTGLARDGGLLLRETIPDVSGRLADWRRLSYVELAGELLSLFADLPPADLRALIARSYASFRAPEVAPVRPVGPLYILELFHGPTLAFKDFALQFLGNLFEYLLQRRGGELNLLGATSGDTGSAAIHGARGRRGMRIFIMHPRGRISPVQERQMTTVLDANVFNLAIEGSFDDCQRILKELFNDLPFRDRYALGAVNSINWVRVLAQIVYYFYAAFRVQEAGGAREVTFAVPTGNFGDIFAGYLAGRMGLPVRRLILATNENDILARFFNTGEYRLGPVVPTISPSMDIQVASNFERYLYYRCREDAGRLRALMEEFARRGRLSLPPEPDSAAGPPFTAGVGDRAATLAAIRRMHAEYGYLLDPHSAVGVHVALEQRQPGEAVICLATAHPAKFGEAIREATGRNLARHPLIDGLRDLPTRLDVLPASAAAVRAYLAERIPL